MVLVRLSTCGECIKWDLFNPQELYHALRVAFSEYVAEHACWSVVFHSYIVKLKKKNIRFLSLKKRSQTFVSLKGSGPCMFIDLLKLNGKSFKTISTSDCMWNTSFRVCSIHSGHTIHISLSPMHCIFPGTLSCIEPVVGELHSPSIWLSRPAKMFPIL